MLLSACASGRHESRRYGPAPDVAPEKLRSQKGIASWYGPGFHGKLTASGEPYNMFAFTCAHNTYPMGTKVRVTNLDNKKSVVVTVNDRGPFAKNRIIDLSYAAAKKLGMIGPGTARVRVEPVGSDARYLKYIKAYSIEKGPFTVQVGSYGERINAVRMMKALKGRYRSSKPYVFEAVNRGRRLYRVRVGKFRTRSEAEDYAADMARDGYDVRVVPYEERI